MSNTIFTLQWEKDPNTTNIEQLKSSVWRVWAKGLGTYMYNVQAESQNKYVWFLVHTTFELCSKYR